MATIDLNSDLGEGIGDDGTMFGLVTSANIACGGHAGDERSMRESVALAVAHGVSVGAHPSYRDPEHFGRRALDVDPDELHAEVMRQVESLGALAASGGARVAYLKPHGALYNRIAVDAEQADAVARAARDSALPLLGQADTAIHRVAERYGVRFYREAFVDRAYLPDGRLAPRDTEGAVITEPRVAAERALRMIVDGAIAAVDGSELRLEPDSLCVHGDTPGSVSIAVAVRDLLTVAGVELKAFV